MAPENENPTHDENVDAPTVAATADTVETTPAAPAKRARRKVAAPSAAPTEGAAVAGEDTPLPAGEDAPARKTAAKRARKATTKKAATAEVEMQVVPGAPDAPAPTEVPDPADVPSTDEKPRRARKTAARKTSARKAVARTAEAEPVVEAEPVAEPALEADDATEQEAAKPAKRARRKKVVAPQQAPAETQGEDDAVPVVAVIDADALPDVTPAEEQELEQIEDVSAEVAAEETPAPSFGVLFQAPTPARRSRRVATSGPVTPPPAPAPAPQAEEPAEEQPEAEDEDTADDDAQGGRRRRRRGGKGRRGRVAERADEQTGDDAVARTEPEDAVADAEDDDAGEGTSRRRRRRRSRSGSDDESSSRRRARDEVVGVKGSTRLEAKKQRRREGREAGRRRSTITEAEFLARRESVDRVMVVKESHDHTQIGVLEDGVLVEHYISSAESTTAVGNIYLGRVQNVLPSMEAAFVDIGKGRNAVLYAGEVNWDAAGIGNGQARRIEDALKSGGSVLVQVTKDPIGHKGARLTSQISLPGRYLVYVPNSSMTGISRKLPDTERQRLKRILKEVVPSDGGVIVRTAAEGASEEELRADVERLVSLWDKIQAKARTASAPSLLHGEADMTVRVIRDVFNEDFGKLVVAGGSAYDEVRSYVESVAPDLGQRVEKWVGPEDLFASYRVDEALAKAMDRKVWLPSGGSLIIDRTEAMTVIDVNTGKFVGAGGNLEETVTKNNLEAAEEIVRQLRLRDIGGIIVVDFIDMVLESNRDLVVRRLVECLGRDRTKHQVAEVTSLGLVQMTRKRVGAGLIEVFSEQCAHCAGRGIVVSTTPVGTKPAPPEGTGPTEGSTGGRKKRRGQRSTPEVPVTSVRTIEPPRNGGPTAAQIAAAAHAAAVSATVMVQDADDEPVSDAPAAARPAVVPTEREREVLESEVTEATATDVTGHATEPGAGTGEAEELPVVSGSEPEVAQPAPVTRRRRGRVTAPAGAPHGEGDLA